MQSMGVFWGADSTPKPCLSPSRSTTVGHRRRSKLEQRVTTLPTLFPTADQTRELDQKMDIPCAHDSTLSLLTVLQTLWRSIAEDSNRFTGRIIDSSASPHRVVEVLQGNYYSKGVFDEDRSYFLNERKLELQQQASSNRVADMRQTHYATDDNQRYSCDRRRQVMPHTHGDVQRLTERHTDSQLGMENRLIDRHDHKIRHLLHILQAEIANETKREIRALNYWCPCRPTSRQIRKRIAGIIKERYEAADRIMRILEEYRILIGVDVAKYLAATIAEGKALSKNE